MAIIADWNPCSSNPVALDIAGPPIIAIVERAMAAPANFPEASLNLSTDSLWTLVESLKVLTTLELSDPPKAALIASVGEPTNPAFIVL